MERENHLFCFGLGYTAGALAQRIIQRGWQVGGTTRSSEKQRHLQERGVQAVDFAGLSAGRLAGITHVLASVPPAEDGDAVLNAYAEPLAQLPQLRWMGYLSTTGVYGDCGGAWVEETAPVSTATPRLKQRAEAEKAWRTFGEAHDIPVHIFRLAGIYGPGRNALRDVLDGAARRIIKPGHVFCRAHVEDIAGVVEAAMGKPAQSGIYNVADDLPAPSEEVVAYACALLGRTPPPPIPYEDASLSPMMREFYSACRRIANQKAKHQLGYGFCFPTYREGLSALFTQETGTYYAG